MNWPFAGREADLEHARELVISGTGVAILGAAGVGKSRLLHELADGVEADGMAVVRAVATEATGSIPFSPFVELLPVGPTPDRLMMLGMALEALSDRTTRRGLVIIVDDAHHLDESSLAFLINASTSESAIVCLTARSGEPMAPDLVGLWTNGVIERVDVGPLDRTQSRMLVEARLGEIRDDLDDELWRLAKGNALVLHELIEGAGDVLHRDGDGRWMGAGPLTESARLGDLVSSRLRAIPDRLRPAMDIVAVGSPLALDLLSAAVGDDVDTLESRGMISTETIAGQLTVVPAHPLYGEVLEANLSRERKQAAYQALVEATLAISSPVDDLRAAIWQRDSGTLVAADLAIGGAMAALVRHDPALAEELVRPLGTKDGRVAALLGRALSYQQRFAEAEELLASADPPDPNLAGRIASIRAQNLGFGLGRISEAKVILEKAAGTVTESGLRARLLNERAMISAIRGDFVDARAASEAVLDDENSSGVAQAAAYVSLLVALAMTADCDRFGEVVDAAQSVTSASRQQLPFAADQVGIMLMQNFINAGRIPEAVDLAEAAVIMGDRGTAMRPTWLSAIGLAHDLAGNHSRAISAAEEALELYAEADPFGLEVQTRGVLALQLGQLGDLDAGAVVDGLPEAIPAPRLSVWVARGRAWTAVAHGCIDEAVEILIAGGRQAIAGEHFAWAALCLHDVVRLGQPALVIDDLRSLDSSRGAHLIANLQAHGEALLASDPDALVAVAGRFGEMGAATLAAETWAQASVAHDSNGEAQKAARCVATSSAFERMCESLQTPALAIRPPLVSDRELDVAMYAASGETSSQISDHLFISVRTVDNHLSSIYRKLGLKGRDELAELLAVPARLSRPA